MHGMAAWELCGSYEIGTVMRQNVYCKRAAPRVASGERTEVKATRSLDSVDDLTQLHGHVVITARSCVSSCVRLSAFRGLGDGDGHGVSVSHVVFLSCYAWHR